MAINVIDSVMFQFGNQKGWLITYEYSDGSAGTDVFPTDIPANFTKPNFNEYTGVWLTATSTTAATDGVKVHIPANNTIVVTRNGTANLVITLFVLGN